MADLTVTEAAARVNRTRRTIENWITAGLQVTYVGKVRYIDEGDLLAMFRKQLQAPKGGKGKPRHG